ncbi:hypothetical protein B0F90DRAFT_1777732 [Multifurca ochricompacta]|uniref:Uncharacterized protein n=1 Tax=Multifurca ochricompacta TaxID=376703 RepID=A0AAD4QF43_9AGAM|nr:hypothetical protein B0F90DRAFT_1777732 [Multifurca ochricompacta]
MITHSCTMTFPFHFFSFQAIPALSSLFSTMKGSVFNALSPVLLCFLFMSLFTS